MTITAQDEKVTSRGIWVRVAIPTLMSLVLFVIAIFFVEIPEFKKSLMSQKRDGVRNVVQLGLDIIHRQYKLEQAGIVSRKEAQKRALSLLATMRFGVEKKDYFWVNDMQGVMLMHPYRPELENKLIIDLEDIEGTELIREFIEIVEREGGGFVKYYWQWQDQRNQIEQKISYVEGFEPWGWVLGSGLYLDDIDREVSTFIRSQLWTMLGITVIIVLLACISIWQGVKADRQMAQTFGLFKAIFNQTYQFIGLMNIEGQLMRVNQSALGFLGAMPKDVVGEYFWDTDWWNYSEEQSTLCREAVEKARRGQVVRGKAFHKNFLGDLRVVDFSIKPIRGAGGDVMYLLAEGRDVTDWKMAEDALRANEQYSRMLFEQAIIGLAVVDGMGKFTDVNDSFAKIIGDTPSGLVGALFIDCLPVKDDPELHPDEDGKVRSVEKWILRRDGNVVPVRLAGMRFSARSGERIMYSVEDITELKQAEEELRLSEEKYRDLVQDAQSVILRWSTDGTILFANEFGVNLFGFSEEELVGKRMTDTIMPEGEAQEALPELVKTIATSPDNYHYAEMWNVCRDGRQLWVSWTSKPLFDSTGKLSAVLSVGLDSTERKIAQDELKALNEELEQRVEARTNALKKSLDSLKKTQEQLVESEKMASLGGLVAGVAHEINTPIGVGVTTISFLQQKANEMEKLYAEGKLKRSDFEKFINLSMESSSAVLLNLSRASELIQSFKQVAVDQTSEERRRFELKGYIHEVLLSLRSKYKRTQHTVSVEGDEAELDSYPGAIMQVLTNLLMNTLKHGFDGIESGNIRITVEDGEESVRMVYADDGVGMDEDTRNRIFDPFYTTKRGRGGTGLGMHIVYNLITQRLQGTILCKSEKGEGTTFIVELPKKGRLPEADE
ncbi:PAS domain S-box protein [Salidesulfovibrio brasiliensis]|uniref:PAS domain S-box protein n=1 Tax=Salidesulfovibrio brasiliensis TaxID=221711 RepID=UPI0009FA98E5|nr:PAS domain S-box protein [Salidesulfovibrio brasiliensis]